MIALAALQLRDERPLANDTVVVTVMSNLGLPPCDGGAGVTVVETAVGDRYVLEALEAGGLRSAASRAVTSSIRDVATTGDGLLGGPASGRTSRDRPAAGRAGRLGDDLVPAGAGQRRGRRSPSRTSAS